MPLIISLWDPNLVEARHRLPESMWVSFFFHFSSVDQKCFLYLTSFKTHFKPNNNNLVAPLTYACSVSPKRWKNIPTWLLKIHILHKYLIFCAKSQTCNDKIGCICGERVVGGRFLFMVGKEVEQCNMLTYSYTVLIHWCRKKKKNRVLGRVVVESCIYIMYIDSLLHFKTVKFFIFINN